MTVKRQCHPHVEALRFNAYRSDHLGCCMIWRARETGDDTRAPRPQSSIKRLYDKMYRFNGDHVKRNARCRLLLLRESDANFPHGNQHITRIGSAPPLGQHIINHLSYCPTELSPFPDVPRQSHSASPPRTATAVVDTTVLPVSSPVSILPAIRRGVIHCYSWIHDLLCFWCIIQRQSATVSSRKSGRSPHSRSLHYGPPCRNVRISPCRTAAELMSFTSRAFGPRIFPLPMKIDIVLLLAEVACMSLAQLNPGPTR
jgi:hypothetical protein